MEQKSEAWRELQEARKEFEMARGHDRIQMASARKRFTFARMATRTGFALSESWLTQVLGPATRAGSSRHGQAATSTEFPCSRYNSTLPRLHHDVVRRSASRVSSAPR